MPILAPHPLLRIRCTRVFGFRLRLCLDIGAVVVEVLFVAAVVATGVLSLVVLVAIATISLRAILSLSMPTTLLVLS